MSLSLVTTFLAAAATIADVHGFAVSSAVSPNGHDARITRMSAVADSPMRGPAEYQKEEDEGAEIVKKMSDAIESGWTKTESGFVPKIPQRKEKTSRISPSVERVETIEEYKATVVDESDRMVVVRFSAPWCKACRASGPLFRKTVGEFSSADVKFVEVPLTKENAYLHEGLGVPSVPFCHIYHPEVGLVEEMKMKNNDIPSITKVLGDYVAGGCYVPDFFFLDDDDNDDIIGEFQ